MKSQGIAMIQFMQGRVRLMFCGFVLTILAIGSSNAYSGQEQVPATNPTDKSTAITTFFCPIGYFIHGYLDATGTLRRRCAKEGSGNAYEALQGLPVQTPKCGGAGWEQGVYNWRGEFVGTICNYPNGSSGGN